MGRRIFRAMAETYFTKLTNAPYKRFVELGEGTHTVMLEKNRMQFFHEILGFLRRIGRPRGEVAWFDGDPPINCVSRSRPWAILGGWRESLNLAVVGQAAGGVLGAVQRRRLCSPSAAAGDTTRSLMSKEELLEFPGFVVELLPNATFRVKLENDHEIIAHTAGKMARIAFACWPATKCLWR